ncbi:MAG: flagellar hook-length control protein FliK [Alphaproteobacteria bacterium]|nr:MAG: flagellar hook-length control protein FliK [Alphaproteobacteria bacterium]
MASPSLDMSASSLTRDKGGKTPSARPAAANAGSHAAASFETTSGLTRQASPATARTPVVNAANSDTASTGQTIANPFHATSPGNAAAGASSATIANTPAIANISDATLGNRTAADGSALASSVTETSGVHHPAHASGLAGDRPTVGTEAAQRPFQVPEPPARQLEIQLTRHAAAGRSHFTLRLDPPELGRVQVSLQFSGDGRVEAAIRTDHPHALDLLQRDARLLERALSQAGFRTDGGLQFSLNQHSSQQQHGHGHPGSGDLSGQNGTGNGTGGENAQGHGPGAQTARQTGEEGGLHDADEAAHGDVIFETGNDTVKERMIRLPERLDIEV